ncbi:MAG: hypothetical protein NW201_09170, partial [Gemmatimonadales bacterium]|nr:hypothetical protein [Gemmatimonadales bacterium]
IAPAAAQDPGFRPPALAPQGPPPIPKGALGWTFCRAGVAESWIRADIVGTPEAEAVLAHEAVHREQARQFESCEAWVRSLVSARRVIDAEIPAACAELNVTERFRGVGRDSLLTEYALRIATQSGALENRLDIRLRLSRECVAPPDRTRSGAAP